MCVVQAATCSLDKTVRLWDLRTQQSATLCARTCLRRRPASVLCPRTASASLTDRGSAPIDRSHAMHRNALCTPGGRSPPCPSLRVPSASRATACTVECCVCVGAHRQPDEPKLPREIERLLCIVRGRLTRLSRGVWPFRTRSAVWSSRPTHVAPSACGAPSLHLHRRRRRARPLERSPAHCARKAAWPRSRRSPRAQRTYAWHRPSCRVVGNSRSARPGAHARRCYARARAVAGSDRCIGLRERRASRPREHLPQPCPRARIRRSSVRQPCNQNLRWHRQYRSASGCAQR